MEYKTFGDKKNEAIMLIHGNLMSWKQFKEVIPLLSDAYYVIAVSLDGFDSTGKTTYPGAEKEADLLAQYIKDECGGKLNCLFGESLGCCPAVLLKSNITIQIEHMILSGPECLDCGLLNNFLVKVMPKKQYELVIKCKTKGYQFPKYLLRLMGQTQEKVERWHEDMADHISMETIRQTWQTGVFLYRQVDQLPVQVEAKVACWYREKESGMKKAIKKLGRLYPGLHTCCFKGYGHGEIISHPEQLVKELKAFIS